MPGCLARWCEVHQQRRRRGADFPRHLETTTSASVGHGAFRTGLAAVAGIAELNMNGRKMHNPKQRPVRRAAVGAAAQCLVPGLYRSQNNTHCGPVRAGSWCRADGSSGPATVMGRRRKVVGQDPPGLDGARPLTPVAATPVRRTASQFRRRGPRMDRPFSPSLVGGQAGHLLQVLAIRCAVPRAVGCGTERHARCDRPGNSGTLGRFNP